MKIHELFIILSALLVIVQCTQKDKSKKIPSDALASAGSQYIMPNDLSYRLEFTPHRPLPGLSPQEKKEAYLQPLIDEMLMAAAAADLRLDTNRVYQLRVREIEKDEVREALFFEEVGDKTEVTEDQYAEAVQRSKQELLVNYITFRTREEAEYIRSMLASGEATFQEAFEIVYKAGLEPPSVNVRWGQMKPEVEGQIYNLEPGQVTDIIETGNGFMIMQLDTVKNITPRSTEDYEKHVRKVRQQLEERVLNEASREYVLGVMGDVSIDVDNEGISILNQYIEQRQPEKPERNPDSLRAQLPTREIRWKLNLPREQRQQKLVTFDSRTWQVQDFLEIALGRGMKMPDKSKSVPVWLKNTLGQFIRDEILANVSYEQGLDTTATVRHKVNRWENYYRSSLYTEHVESQLSESNSYTTALKSKLDSLRSIYPPRVNRQQLRQIDLMESQMIVMKHGSFNRLAVPPYPQSLLQLHSPLQDTQTQSP